MVNIQILSELANAQTTARPHLDKIPWSPAQPKDYTLVPLMLMGRDVKDMIGQGTGITTLFDPIIDSSQFAAKRHGEDHKRGGTSTMFEMTTRYSEYEWNKGILWHDIAMQVGDVFSEDGSQRFYKILEKREKDFALDPVNKMEKELARVPAADMFAADAAGRTRIKSIWTGVNLWETRHGATAEGLFPNMTSQQGLDPADANFQRVDGFGGSMLAPHKVYYDEIATNNTGINGHFFDQLQFLLDTMGWQPTPMAGKWSEGLEVKPTVLHCSHEGKIWFNQTNRAHGDHWAVINPIGNPSKQEPTFGDIPLKASSVIRDAKVYPDTQNGTDDAGAAARFTASGAGVDEFDTDGIAGPRFYGFDPRSFGFYMHKDRAWEQGPWKTMEPVNEDEMRRLGKFLGNLHFESFLGNCILAPRTSISNYTRGNLA